MIEINLLPDGMGLQKRRNKPAAGVPDLRRFLYLIPAIVLLTVILHIYLAVLGIGKNNLLQALSKQWEAAAPQRRELDDFNQKYALMSESIEAIRSLGGNRVAWAPKLDSLSRNLPAGIWFKGIMLKPGNFTLEGSVISLEKEEMNQVKAFIENLKKDEAFTEDFDNMELGSVERRALGDFNIIDFTLTGKLKT